MTKADYLVTELLRLTADHGLDGAVAAMALGDFARRKLEANLRGVDDARLNDAVDHAAEIAEELEAEAGG